MMKPIFAALAAATLLPAQGGLTWHVNPANGHSYAVTSGMTWAQGEALALQFGGHLATVRTAAEDAWLMQAFVANAADDARFWIGMTDEASEGTWLWSSGDSANYTNWGLFEPDNAGGAQHYATLWKLPGGVGGGVGWSDDYATAVWPAIVEVPSLPSFAWHTNPGNGHRYALTPSLTWQAAEAMAVQVGGHLATVRSQAEQDWIWSTFGTQSLWIGFSDAAVEGLWAWSSGEAVVYTNWLPNEPNDLNGEDYAAMATGGGWNDGAATVTWRGVVEVVDGLAMSVAYGSGCGTTPLGLEPNSDPVVGGVASATITNAPTLAAGVTMGWSDTFVAGLPLLPVDLTPFGMSGCLLWHSNDVLGFSATPLGPDSLQFDYSIPFDLSLVGARVFIQAYCYSPGANQLQIVTSNGVAWTVGV